MIDLENENLVLLKDVCRMFPGRSGRGVSLSTIWRWMLTGRKGHKLESLIVGGQRYTSKEAVHRFTAACNGKSVSRCRRSVSRRTHELQRIDHELQVEGF